MDIEAPRADRCTAEDQTRQTTAQLHTAGPNIPDRDIRLDLLGPAALGSIMVHYGKVALLTAIPHVIDWDIAPLCDAPL
jgi:hypothetical protein